MKVENSTATEGFVADENGHVTGLKVVNVAPGENGPFTRQPGTERVIPADLVLISVASCTLTPPRWWISCRSTLTVEAMWRVTTSSPPPRTASSPAVTPDVARASSCGPSPKVAPALPRSTSTLPAPPNCRHRSSLPSVR